MYEIVKFLQCFTLNFIFFYSRRRYETRSIDYSNDSYYGQIMAERRFVNWIFYAITWFFYNFLTVFFYIFMQVLIWKWLHLVVYLQEIVKGSWKWLLMPKLWEKFMWPEIKVFTWNHFHEIFREIDLQFDLQIWILSNVFFFNLFVSFLLQALWDLLKKHQYLTIWPNGTLRNLNLPLRLIILPALVLVTVW